MTFAFEYYQAIVNDKFPCELYLLFEIEEFSQKDNIVKEKLLNNWPDFVIKKWVNKEKGKI